MELPYLDRSHAGALLADSLSSSSLGSDITVFAPANGGVPVALAAANQLGVPWEILVVQKVRLQERTSVIGAVADKDVDVRRQASNHPLSSKQLIESAFTSAKEELAKRRTLFAPYATQFVKGRTAVIVDDGAETGVTLLAAIRQLRQAGADRIIVAIPVGSPEALALLTSECDHLICLAIPRPFNNITECYIKFPQLTDRDSLALMQTNRPKTA